MGQAPGKPMCVEKNWFFEWRHDTQHNDTQHHDTQHNKLIIKGLYVTLSKRDTHH
jgi:hypothetical protein